MTSDDEGGGGAIPPKNDDVIYEQPLIELLTAAALYHTPIGPPTVATLVEMQYARLTTTTSWYLSIVCSCRPSRVHLHREKLLEVQYVRATKRTRWDLSIACSC